MGGSELAIVVIDPGHGGSATIPNDSTWNKAVGPNGTLEKTLTLDIGLRVLAGLAAAGHRAIATRTTDVNLRLRDRAGVAKTAKADVFVSIHLNGSRGHDAQGTETLVESNHTARSARLRLAVQDALLPVTGLRDRNAAHDHATRIKPQGLAVLKLGSHFPETAACLAEISFLDRIDEERRLQDTTYRHAIAGALVRGITAYLATVAPSRGRAVGFGDAIESEAGSARDARIAKFLDLAKPVRQRQPELLDSEAGEQTSAPADPFAPAFLKGGGRGLAGARSIRNWADHSDFTFFINGLGLSDFHADEFLELGTSNGSGKCKGLSDFTCQSGTPEIWRRIAVRLRAQDARFAGGIGTYSSQNFVHIDTRGEARDWAKP